MNTLQFIFSNFWVWLGVNILVMGTLEKVAETIKSIRKPERELEVIAYNDRMVITKIKNPEPGDYERVISALPWEIKDREFIEPKF